MLRCPLCGNNLLCKETRTTEDNTEVYRQRYCRVCDKIYYTVEFETEANEDFFKLWHDISRWHIRDERSKEIRHQMKNMNK